MDKLELTIAGDQRELTIRDGQAAPPYVYNGFNYKTTDTDSFVAAVSRFGGKNTVMAANGGKIKAIVDCTIVDRDQSTITQEWALSKELIRWTEVLDKRIDQQKFIKFLERELRLFDSVQLQNLLAQLKTLKISTQIMGDYSMDDRNNYVVMYKTANGEGTSKIPAYLELAFPLIDGGREELIGIEIEFIQPSQPGEKPMFGLTVPGWKDLVQQSIDYEVDCIRTRLPGWLLIKGNV